MRKLTIGVLLAVMLISMLPCISQITVTLVADYDAAIGYHDGYNTASNNYSTAAQNAAYVIHGTHSSGGLNVNRALIHFDLSVIPANAIVTSATMNLYSLGPPQYTIAHSGTNNSTLLQRVIQTWNHTTVTWNNQPLATSQNQVTLPPHTVPLQNYLNIPVTQIVLDMISTNNYGFLLKLFNEVPVNALVFASLNCGVPAKFPTLEITYILPLKAPPIHCLEVQNNGDVLLSWEHADTSLLPFHSYKLYSSLSVAGPFTLIDSITDINTLSTTHWGAGANNHSVYYFLTTVYSSPGLPESDPYDTTRTIYLNITGTTPPGSNATLTWNPTHNPLLATSSGVYEVWREYPAGTWLMAGNTSALTFTDTMIICNDLVPYRIEIKDTLSNSPPGPSFCSSVSNINTAHYQYTYPPPPPEIFTVTVDSSASIPILTWKMSSYAGTEGYIVYTFSNGVYAFLDTMHNRSDTTLADMINDPCAGPVTYAVATYDSCGNVSLKSLHHNSIFPVIYQPYCNNEITISWNDYINMAPHVAGYQIYVMTDGGLPQLIATVSGNTSFTHTNLSVGSNYCYLIRAFNPDNSQISESCIKCHILEMPEPPGQIYIATASVENNSSVIIKLFNDNPTLPVYSYDIYRSEDNFSYQPIGCVLSPAGQITDFSDHTAAFHTRSYYYLATVTDICGNITDTSNTVRTIHLKAEKVTFPRGNYISWNDYEGFNGLPTTYNLYRGVDAFPDLSPFISFTSSTEEYTDGLGTLSDCKGFITYQIEAVEGPGNIFGLNERSFSNAVTLQMDPLVYIPSAFSPDGVVQENRVFVPKGLCISPDGYGFSIFNRYGQNIFHTDDPEQGWDGTYDGKRVEEGVYAYIVNYTLPDGSNHIKRGTVTLIR